MKETVRRNNPPINAKNRPAFIKEKTKATADSTADFSSSLVFLSILSTHLRFFVDCDDRRYSFIVSLVARHTANHTEFLIARVMKPCQSGSQLTGM